MQAAAPDLDISLTFSPPFCTIWGWAISGSHSAMRGETSE
jgi:hypothetical protein